MPVRCRKSPTRRRGDRHPVSPLARKVATRHPDLSISVPPRYILPRLMGCLCFSLAAVLMVYHSLIFRADHNIGGSGTFRIAVASGLGNLAVSAFFPADDNVMQVLGTFVSFALSAVMIHVTSAEWERRPHQEDQQTIIRRAVMLCMSSVLLAGTATLAAGVLRKRPIMRVWTVFRLMYAAMGLLDFTHTCWLLWDYDRSVPHAHKMFTGHQIGGRTYGKPSFSLGLWLMTIAIMLNERVRRFVARMSGGDKLRMHLGQLTHSEFRHLLPDPSWRKTSDNPTETSQSSKCSQMSSQQEGAAAWRNPSRSASYHYHADSERSEEDAGGWRHERVHDAASERSEESPQSQASTLWSWSSYGKRWEKDWQEQREREIEAERLAELNEYLGTAVPGAGVSGTDARQQAGFLAELEVASFESRQEAGGP